MFKVYALACTVYLIENCGKCSVRNVYALTCTTFTLNLQEKLVNFTQ